MLDVWASERGVLQPCTASAQSAKEFYKCEHCMSMLRQPASVSCEDIDGCTRHGGALVAMSRGSKSFFENAEVDVLCLPRMHEAAIPAAAFALQWVKVHHGRVAQLDLRHTLGMTALVEVAAMLLPWLTFTLAWAIRSRRNAEAVKDKVKSTALDSAVDGARMIGTASIVLLHLNVVFVTNDPEMSKRRIVWFYAHRFADVFGVLAVLVTKVHSENLLGSADALWRKLGRQLPLSFIMVRSRVWTAGICPHFESCGYIDSGWSTEMLLRSLTFSHHWQLFVDLKVWLVFRALHVLNPLSSPILGTVVTAVICVCATMWQHVEENLYYQFWAYRLPMALLVHAVLLRRRQLQDWAAQHPWLWSSGAALLCSFGWVGCVPHIPAGDVPLWWQPACTESGSLFFCGGFCFHLGVLMFCLRPPITMPGALKWTVSKLSPLALGILTLHLTVFFLLDRCKKTTLPWFFVQLPGSRMHLSDDPPRKVALALWTAGTLVSIPLAQVVLATVQQPWERCWSLCPKPISRVLVLVYLLLFLWNEIGKSSPR